MRRWERKVDLSKNVSSPATFSCLLMQRRKLAVLEETSELSDQVRSIEVRVLQGKIHEMEATLRRQAEESSDDDDEDCGSSF